MIFGDYQFFVGIYIGLGVSLVILIGAVLSILARLSVMSGITQRIIKLRVSMVETSWKKRKNA